MNSYDVRRVGQGGWRLQLISQLSSMRPACRLRPKTFGEQQCKHGPPSYRSLIIRQVRLSSPAKYYLIEAPYFVFCVINYDARALMLNIK